MWVVKAKGESYYVDHVECELPWSTKETPDNSHTKGSIKIKKCLITIDDKNCAHITKLGPDDEKRLSGKTKVIRVITAHGRKLRDFLVNHTHGEIQIQGGGCSTTWYVTEIYSDKVLLLLQMAVPSIRVLMPNENYYKWYDQEIVEHELDEDDFYND